MARGDADEASDVGLMVTLPLGRTGLALGALVADVQDLPGPAGGSGDGAKPAPGTPRASAGRSGRSSEEVKRSRCLANGRDGQDCEDVPCGKTVRIGCKLAYYQAKLRTIAHGLEKAGMVAPEEADCGSSEQVSESGLRAPRSPDGRAS